MNSGNAVHIKQVQSWLESLTPHQRERIEAAAQSKANEPEDALSRSGLDGFWIQVSVTEDAYLVCGANYCMWEIPTASLGDMMAAAYEHLVEAHPYSLVHPAEDDD